MSSAITKDLFAFAEDNRPSIVYIATNVKNGKFYIGVTRKTVEKRKSQHANYAAHCGKSHFHKAINKHGIDAFEFSVLKHTDTYVDALKEERRLIEEMRPPYNQSKGGDGNFGYRHSVKSRKKKSDAKIGRPSHWKGKKRAPETIEKMRKRLLEKPIAYWNGKKREMTPAMVAGARRRRKAVICLDDGKVYESSKEASQAYGIKRFRDVNAVCSGKAKSACGRRFSYLIGSTQ